MEVEKTRRSNVLRRFQGSRMDVLRSRLRDLKAAAHREDECEPANEERTWTHPTSGFPDHESFTPDGPV